MDSVLEWLVIFLIAPALIGFVGSLVKRSVLGPKSEWPAARPKRRGDTPMPGSGFAGFQRFYFVTLGWHPLLAGLVVGLIGHWIGLPSPGAFGTGYAGTILAYSFAGMVASVGYDAIVKTIRRIIAGVGDVLTSGAGGGAGRFDE